MENRKKIIFIGSFLFFLGNMICSFGSQGANIDSPKVQNLSPRNEHYVKRKQLTQKIKNNLGKTDHFLVLVGMAGMGKTQLAKEYAHDYAAQYDIVWWIDANQDLLPQLRELGQELKAFEKCSIPSSTERDQKRWLSNISACCNHYFFKGLFIVDDIKDKNLAQQLNEELKNVHILLTSRDPFIDEKTMTLKSFTREESIEYLGKLLPEEPHRALDLLAKTLNDYPLALAQAASYIRSFPSLTVEEYLKLYNEKRKVLWEKE